MAVLSPAARSDPGNSSSAAEYLGPFAITKTTTIKAAVRVVVGGGGAGGAGDPRWQMRPLVHTMVYTKLEKEEL